jgi:hypothetical protein
VVMHGNKELGIGIAKVCDQGGQFWRLRLIQS